MMLGSSCSPCCGGPCPIEIPDSIELTISADATDNASIIIGSWPDGAAAPTPSIAWSLCWRWPSGTYALTKTQTGPTTFAYAYSGNGITLTASVSSAGESPGPGDILSYVSLTAKADVFRPKSFSPGSIPEWSDGFAECGPTLAFSGRCSFFLEDICRADSSPTRNLFMGLDAAANLSQFLCLSGECGFPATWRMGSRVIFSQVTTDLAYHRAGNAQYLIQQTSNVSTPHASYAEVTGYASASVASVNGVYGLDVRPLFGPRNSLVGGAGCSAGWFGVPVVSQTCP